MEKVTVDKVMWERIVALLDDLAGPLTPLDAGRAIAEARNIHEELPSYVSD